MKLLSIRFGLLLLALFGLGALLMAATPAPADGDASGTVYLPAVQGGGAVTTPTPADIHPRLWLTNSDLPRLRSWATEANPLWRDGLALLAARAKTEMDEGRVPDQDCGNVGYEEYPTEMYAELFAFLSLVDNDADARADYAARARTLLMHIMQEAVKGPASAENYTCNESQQYPPFRHPDFATEDRDRIRYHGEAFPLVVDWIYPILSAEDKATIRAVFLRWSQEVIERGYHHPVPVGITNDAALLADQQQMRFSGNNYYAAHMRNLGMMALALDPADDANAQLRGYLNNAIGAYLYIFDHLTRTDSRGGLLPEGLEYSPQTLGYATQFLLSLHTTGASYPVTMTLSSNPFWDQSIDAYLHSLSPAPVTRTEGGIRYEPAFYGDGQSYHLPDFISAFAPIGLYDIVTANPDRLNAIRWLQSNTAPGGANFLAERVRNPVDFREAILYFMLYDPAATITDPSANRSTDFLAAGLNRLFSRTDWSAAAAWFTFGLSWNSIDHQMADGNHFSFYRNGEWLTKGRVGYADIAEGIASSEFYNSVAIHNDRPADRDDSDWRVDLWQRGSQWNYVNDGDPRLLATSTGSAYVYALGDATPLYNSTSEGAVDVAEVVRAIVWLKPDHIVVYDRAVSKSPGHFKRWWLQLPTPAVIQGNRATMTTAAGQQLFVTNLLPADAVLSAVNVDEPQIANTAAADDPMKVRLRVDAPNAPLSVEFVHLLQGADAGAAAHPAALLQNEANTVKGVVFAGRAVLFVTDTAAAQAGFSYTVPTTVTEQIVTGLLKQQTYQITRSVAGDSATISIVPGAGVLSDAGGVLVFGE
jgi:hypothetical protein